MQLYKIIVIWLNDGNLDLDLSISNQLRVVAVPVRRDLEREERKGVPFVDWDD